jgi:Uma2 family endonuclease
MAQRLGKWSSLGSIAEEIEESRPGWRAEVHHGQIVVVPLRDGPHAEILTEVLLSCVEAGLHRGANRVLPGIGLRLPGGPDGYAVPHLSVVTADYREHLVRATHYAPDCFRLVVDIAHSGIPPELGSKRSAYADAGVPAQVVVDRHHGRLHVLTDPSGDDYAVHRVHAPGEIVTLPDSVGAEVTLDVGRILRAGGPTR